MFGYFVSQWLQFGDYEGSWINNPWLWVSIWIGVTILAVIIELVTDDLTSIWFAIGAFVSLIISIFTNNYIVQIAVFILLSVLLMLFIKPLLANRYGKRDTIPTNADRVIGKVGKCTQHIDRENYGEVKVDGKIWTAAAYEDETIEVDDEVEILGIDGVKLIVRRSK